MSVLLVGFDSAWTAGKRGALVAALQCEDGSLRDLGPPQLANFPEAEHAIRRWQHENSPSRTVILIDQPIVVANDRGQRPVESIVCSPVSLRRGGMQPANTARKEMFGPEAPVWPFLERFGGAADPNAATAGNVVVYETYPVLAIVALGWCLADPDSRPAGRLPKYNPERRKTFALADWDHVCNATSKAFRERSLSDVASWLDEVRAVDKPRKGDQDKLDACLCLLVALHLAEGRECLMVGNRETGYIVVPDCPLLHAELGSRCEEIERTKDRWTTRFRLPDLH